MCNIFYFLHGYVLLSKPQSHFQSKSALISEKEFYYKSSNYMYDVKDSKERDENRHGIPNKSRQTMVINKTQLVSG